MTKNSKDSRRKLLKSIAAGSGAVVAGKSLPESWSKPVIDSIVLPAHAATTDDTGSGGPGVTTTGNPSTTPQLTTTPDPCCEIAETYCGVIGNDVADIDITVTIDGAVSIVVYSGREPARAVTSVTCSGGSFSVDSSDGRTVTGTVGCGHVTITGEYGGQPYSASVNGCSGE